MPACAFMDTIIENDFIDVVEDDVLIHMHTEFSSVGSYGFSYSPSINLLSKRLHLPVTPTIHAKAQGFMRTRTGTQIAEVEFSGTLLQASLPQVLSQDFNVWPQKARYTV